MSRPRTVSDEDVLAMTFSVLEQAGGDVPLERISERVGLSPPAILKRFGSKKKLLALSLMVPASHQLAPTLEAGPDDRPFRIQLLELSESTARLFDAVTPRLAIRRALGIDPVEMFATAHPGEEPPPLRDHHLLSAWLRRCHERGLIVEAPYDTVAAMFFGSFREPSFMRHTFGDDTLPISGAQHASAVAHLIADALEPR